MKINERLKASEAVLAMTKGLWNHGVRRQDFQINMNTFGYAQEDMCYGCAATCALQQIMGTPLLPNGRTEKTLTTTMGRIKVLNRNVSDPRHKLNGLDTKEFEMAIDFLRVGREGAFQRYFNVPVKVMSTVMRNTRKKIRSDTRFPPRWRHYEESLPDLRNYNWKGRLWIYRELAHQLKLAGY